jgi:HK97 family phage major capsid protein
LGYPVEFEENMPDFAANSLPVAFGNFKLAYVIVDRVGIRFLRDVFTAKPNMLFYGYRRYGGGVANSEAVKVLRASTS